MATAGLFFCLFPHTAMAQRAAGPSTIARPGMERIDAAEGAARLASFREQRLAGDFVFEFELEHKPRRERTRRYAGTLWGTWNRDGSRMRIRLLDAAAGSIGSKAPANEWIIQNGPRPRAWTRPAGSEQFQPVEGGALFEPLLPGLTYTLFDLQMPFIFWQDAVYEGPVLVAGSRIAQTFLLSPPADSEFIRQGIQAVRIGLDDTYNALLRVEVIDLEGRERSRFQVESFQKVDDQYIVKKITLTDNESRDRTSFQVMKADVGLRLDADLFAVEKEESPVAGPFLFPVKSDCGSE